MAAEIIPLRREKVVLDTSVYIGFFNRGLYAEPIEELLRSATVFLHSVVFEELLAGAASQRERRDLSRFKKPYSKANRLVTPNDNDWEETGLVLNRLMKKGGLPANRAVSLTHDILLALSLRRAGIRIVTENGRDFERIRSIREFKFTVWKPGLKN